LNLLKAESWFCHFFRYCITIFISLLKQIHDVDFLLKMKHFMNASIVCFFSEFDQNVFAFKKFVRIFSLWFIWIFFCDVCYNDFFLINDRNNNLIWIKIILCFWFCVHSKACRSVVVCMNCMLFDFLQTLAWFCSHWVSFIAVWAAAEFFFIFDWALIIFVICLCAEFASSDDHELLNKFIMFIYLNFILIFSTAFKAGRFTILRWVKSLIFRQFTVCFLSIYHLISYLDNIF